MIFSPKFRQLLLTSASLSALFFISATSLKAMDDEDENQTKFSLETVVKDPDEGVRRALRNGRDSFEGFIQALEHFYQPFKNTEQAIETERFKEFTPKNPETAQEERKERNKEIRNFTFAQWNNLKEEKNLLVQAARLKRLIDVDPEPETDIIFNRYEQIINLLHKASFQFPDAQSAIQIALMAGEQAYALEAYMATTSNIFCFSDSQRIAQVKQAAEVWWKLAENPQLHELPEDSLPRLSRAGNLASGEEKSLVALGSNCFLPRQKHLPEKDTKLTLLKAIYSLRAGEDYLSLFSWLCEEKAVQTTSSPTETTTSSSSSSPVLITESTSKTLQQRQMQPSTILRRGMLALTQASEHTKDLSDKDSNPVFALQYAMLAIDIQTNSLKRIRSSYPNKEEFAKIFEREMETNSSLTRELCEQVIKKYKELNTSQLSFKKRGEILRIGLAKAHFHLGMIASNKEEKMTRWQNAFDIAKETLREFMESPFYSTFFMDTFKYDGRDVICLKEPNVPFWHEAINFHIEQERQKN